MKKQNGKNSTANTNGINIIPQLTTIGPLPEIGSQEQVKTLWGYERRWYVEIMENGDTFPELKNLSHDELKDKVKDFDQQVGETIRKYIDVAGSNPEGCLPHFVFGLFNHSSNHGRRVRDMQRAIFSLMKFFSNPEISSQYEGGNKEELDNLMNVMDRLNYFCNAMKDPDNDFTALMDLADVECNYEEESFGRLSFIQDNYKRRIQIEEAKIALQQQD